MIGQSAESILRAMISSSGFSGSGESAHEIELAEQSPYFRGSELLRNRLKKRDWLLSVYLKLNSAPIPRRVRSSDGPSSLVKNSWSNTTAPIDPSSSPK